MNKWKKANFKLFTELTDIKENRFHPLVWIGGNPEIGNNVYIGGMSEMYGKGAKVVIGDNCDIASFVVINCADSHKKTIGISDEIERRDITIENNVYIGLKVLLEEECISVIIRLSGQEQLSEPVTILHIV